MDNFINHYVWSKKEASEVTEVKLSYSQQVLLKLNEMKERRRRLVKYTYQKEFKHGDFEKGYQTVIASKNKVIRSFTTQQLET